MGGRLGKTDTNKLGRGCEPCSLVRRMDEEPRENVQLREWEICLRNEDRFRDDHHPTPSTIASFVLFDSPDNTTILYFIFLLLLLLSFDHRPIFRRLLHSDTLESFERLRADAGTSI